MTEKADVLQRLADSIDDLLSVLHEKGVYENNAAYNRVEKALADARDYQQAITDLNEVG